MVVGGHRGRKLDELVEKARTEKVPINSFDPEAMERRAPCVRNVVVVRGKSVISIKGLLVDHLRTSSALSVRMNLRTTLLLAT